MTLTELCKLFDRYDIVNTQADIDKEYYATIGNIYTDGDIKTTINCNAYIHILSVEDASYLIFVDIEYKIYLCVYKYINESNFKHIKQELQILKYTLKKMKNSINNEDSEDSTDIHINKYINDDIIDINTFTCTECNSKAKMNFTRSKFNPEILETKCNECKTEYSFTPSKYYRMSSKRIVYFKSENASREIKILDNKKDISEKSTISKDLIANKNNAKEKTNKMI